MNDTTIDTSALEARIIKAENERLKVKLADKQERVNDLLQRELKVRQERDKWRELAEHWSERATELETELGHD